MRGKKRLYFKASFEDKEFIKSFGAKWDNNKKLWYCLGEIPPIIALRHGVIQNVDEYKGQKIEHKLNNGLVFAPTIKDESAKDDLALMDIVAFNLSKSKRTTAISYDIPNGSIYVTGGAYGMANVWDYDIVMMILSKFSKQVELYKKGDIQEVSRSVHLDVTEVIKFCKKTHGGRQYKSVIDSLDRLATTFIKIKKQTGKYTRIIAGSLLGLYKVVHETKTGRITEVTVPIPEWIWESFMSVDAKEIITTRNMLSIDSQYFTLKSGIEKFLYRLLRKSVGTGNWKWSFKTLYERSASEMPYRNFKYKLHKIIEKNSLPNFSLEQIEMNEGLGLKATYKVPMTEVIEEAM